MIAIGDNTYHFKDANADASLSVVRGISGRRHRITRDEMPRILAELHSIGIVNIGNGWAGSDRCQRRLKSDPLWRFAPVET